MESNQSYLPILIYPYKSMRDKNLVNLLDFIFISMNNNENFTGLAEQVEEFGNAAAIYSSLVTKAKDRDRNVIAAKNDACKIVIPLVIAISHSVQQQSGPNLAMLTSSGLPLRKARKTRVVAAPNQTIITVDNTTGQAMVKAKGAKGARAFIFKYAQSPITDASIWQSIYSSTSKCTITGLISGAKYFIKAGIIGAKNINLFSEMVLSPFIP